MNQKKWSVLPYDNVLAIELERQLKISPVLCQLLVQRGINTFEKARDFFRPQLSQLLDPFLMKDMRKAVERIDEAILKKEKILVYGDYDVDGTTSVACMFDFLREIYPGNQVEFYIPHRYKEGYGISLAGIAYAKQQGISLIISLDCGIKSAELIQQAKEWGIDFVVCDHHMPDPILPPAVAILNPKQVDCPYPYKDLCGCGVGLKLIQAICQAKALPDEFWHRYLDLTATAIAADIVPITGENRIIAFYGLAKVNDHPNLGIATLMELSSAVKPMTISNLVFLIAPRINAAGRMDDAKKAVQLFLEKNKEEARKIAQLLQSDNQDRKEADKNITDEALHILKSNPDLQEKKTTVVYQPHWHKGVVGIVASRLIDHFYRPTIVLTRSGEIVAGSARSVAGFNVYEAIHACKEHLLGYGGHFAAAGMTLLPEKVEAFSTAFEHIVSTSISEDLLTPEIQIHAELELALASNMNFYKILCQMEPFGPENMRPVFITKNVQDVGGRTKVVKEHHIRFEIMKNESQITGIGFNLAHKWPDIEDAQFFDIVYTLDLNEFQGKKSIQMKVLDVSPSA